MPKTETTYRESVNLFALAKQLQDRYYLHLGYIDMDAIFFADKIGDKPAKSPVIDVNGVRSQWVRQVLSHTSNNKLYCISAWFEAWSELPYNAQEWLMFDTLYSIGVENDGKLRGRDVFEHGIIADFLGVYWRSDKEIPSLLGSKEPLPIPPPPALHDEDDSTL